MEKKNKLRSSKDVFDRIRWEEGRDKSKYVIGYKDRFEGIMEMPLTEFLTIEEGGEIPWSRVYYFREDDVRVWDRETRYDSVFGSGETKGKNEEQTEVKENRIFVTHRSNANKAKLIKARYGDCHILDVTSSSQDPRWVKFSPFYPHGNVPVPFSSPGTVSQTVEGIWQGLKVFEREDVDLKKMTITSMKGLKRGTGGKRGAVKGHQRGVLPPSSERHDSQQIMPYLDARLHIYLPSYKWVLEHCLQDELKELTRLSEEKPVVLLDYETNANVFDLSHPLSHAALIKKYVEGDWHFDKNEDTKQQQQQQESPSNDNNTNPSEEVVIIKETEPSTHALEKRTRQTRVPPSRSVPPDSSNLRQLVSCGVLLFNNYSDKKFSGSREFLLMKHANRYDLPKGHVETNESELECALRELNEETGIPSHLIQINPTFRYSETYYPTYKRFGGERVKKTLVIFLAEWNDPSAKVSVQLTEHQGFQWISWNPPHIIQKNTIDPLLADVADFLSKERRMRSQGYDHEEARQPSSTESVESSVSSNKQEEADNSNSGSSDDDDNKKKQTRGTAGQIRKTRNKRTALVQAGYSLLERTGDGQVSIYDNSDIKFSNKALTTQAKMIVRRNQQMKGYIKDDHVHDYDDNADSGEETEEERNYKPPPRGQLCDFMGAGETQQNTNDEIMEEEWTCGACTFINPPGSTFSCTVCNTPIA